MNFSKGKFVLECHPFIWWMNFILSFLCSIFAIIMIVKFIIIKFFVGVIFMFCFFFISFYWLLSLPRIIVVDDKFLKIIWPWKSLNISLNQIKRIKIKQHRLKSVYIFIFLKDKTFLKVIPIRFDWNFKSEDYSSILKKIEKISKNSPSCNNVRREGT